MTPAVSELVRNGETREVLWNTGTYLQLLWYALAGISVLVFAYGVARPIAKYRRGRGPLLPARGELAGRLRETARVLASHAWIARRDALVGWAHAAIFYGFVVLTIGTTLLAINTDVTERIFGWRFFTGSFYLGYSAVLDVLGLALVLGMLAMIARRYLARPARLDYHRPDRADDDPQQDRRIYRIGDAVFVALLLGIALQGYLLEGVRIAMEDPARNGYQPVGWLVGQAVDGLGIGQGALGAIRHALWWSHGLVAIAWVAAIPYTKAAHMLTSLASVTLRDRDAGRRLVGVPQARAADPVGYGTLGDFSSVHLLQLDACTKCGRCHEVCPANAVGRPLSPRDVVLDLREQANAGMADVGIGGVLGSLLGAGDGKFATNGSSGFARPVVGEDRVREDTIWACYQCNACVTACPVGIEQAPIINQMRRHLVEAGEMDPALASTLQVIHKSGNSFGENRRRRGRWTDGLDFEVPDAREQPVDVVWFVGDYASFDPRSQGITRALATLFYRAGLDFGILYDGERNAGNDVRRVGEEGLFESLAEHNVRTLSDCSFRRIVTSDPHSLNTLRNEYPDYGGEWDVVHHTSLLLELIEAGRLNLGGGDGLGYRVTYHDPCFLGRINGGYEAPRRILELLGCELVEMPRNRDNSFCCGAGGGQIWIPDAPGTRRPSVERIDEAVALGDLDYFVVTCPKDVTMYEDAIKTSGHEGAIELRELTELCEEAVLTPSARP